MNAKVKVLSDFWFQTNDYPRTIVRDFLLSFAFSILIALCSQVAIPLYPVPVTGQTFAVLLTGIVLGSNRALVALMLYVFEGALGLPVFAPGSTIGVARLLGPTGGYILGFAAAAFFLGYLSEKGWDRSFYRLLTAMLAALAVIYVFGLVRLSAFVPAGKLLLVGLLPFIPGEIIKVILVSLSLPWVWKIIKD
jgi:biotin transport system substrate-specific component